MSFQKLISYWAAKFLYAPASTFNDITVNQMVFNYQTYSFVINVHPLSPLIVITMMICYCITIMFEYV